MVGGIKNKIMNEGKGKKTAGSGRPWVKALLREEGICLRLFASDG